MNTKSRFIVFLLMLGHFMSDAQQYILTRPLNGSGGTLTISTDLVTSWTTITGKPSVTNQIWYGAGLQSSSLTFDGNVITAPSVTATNNVSGTNILGSTLVRGGTAGTNGYTQLQGGDATYSGYVSFFTPNQSRAAYIGFAANGGAIQLYSDNAAGFNFMNGRVDLGSNKITGLADATLATDAMNRQSGDARWGQLAANNTWSGIQTFNNAVNFNNNIPIQVNSRNTWRTYQTAQIGDNTLGWNIDGNKLLLDEEFSIGLNGLQIYNNAGGTALVMTRSNTAISGVPIPNSTGFYVKIQVDNSSLGTSPNWGGFVPNIPGINVVANKFYVQRFRALIPVGYNVDLASNGIGTNGTHYWLTSQAGTGKWEEYVRILKTGDSGTFSSSFHVYISGSPTPTVAAPLIWYVCSHTVIDATNLNQIAAQIGSFATLKGADGNVGTNGQIAINNGGGWNWTTPTYAAASAIAGTTNYLAKFTSAGVVGNSLIFDNGTNVGVGTASPITRFSIDKATQSIGATTPSGALLITDIAGSNLGLELGTNTANGNWIQSRNVASQTYYNLLLNPSGGNILIGTTTDNGNKLNISGNVYSSNGFYATASTVGFTGDGSSLYLKAVGNTYLNSANNAFVNNSGGIQATSVISSGLVRGTVIDNFLTANGYIKLTQGGTTNSGYIEFYRPNNARAGYMGYASGTIGGLQYNAENVTGVAHDFVGGVMSLNNQRITNIAAATVGTDAMNRDASDARYAQLNGATFTGAINSNSSIITTSVMRAIALQANGIATDYRDVQWLTSGNLRFVMGVIGAESGSNTGSNLYFARYADNGAFLGSVFDVNRASGLLQFTQEARGVAGSNAASLVIKSQLDAATTAAVSGTVNQIPIFTGTNSIGNSTMYWYNSNGLSFNGTRAAPRYIYANGVADDASLKLRSGSTVGFYSEISIDGWDNTGTPSNINFRTAGVDQMRLHNTGNLSLGTISQLGKLTIVKNSTYNNEGSNGIYIQSGNAASETGLLLGADKANSIAYIQSIEPVTSYGSKSLILNPNNGNVGVGYINPTATFGVVGTMEYSPTSAKTDRWTTYTGGASLIYSGTSTATDIGFITNGSEKVRLLQNGTLKNFGGANQTQFDNERNIYRDVLFNSNNTPIVTGSFVIETPLNANAMVTITLKGYDYSANGSWTATIAGYTYTPLATDSWYSYKGEIEGVAPFKTVTLGYNTSNSKYVIILGGVGTTWNYPKIEITEVIVGYSNNHQNYNTGWSGSFVTSLAAYGNQRAVNLQKQMNGYGIGTYTATPTRMLGVDGVGNIVETNPVTSNISGTANYIPMFSSANVIGNSGIYQSNPNLWGFGTTSPVGIYGATTHISSSTGGSVNLGGTTVKGYFAMSDGLGNGVIGTSSNHPFTTIINGSEVSRYLTNGNFQVGPTGVTDNGSSLQVYKSGTSTFISTNAPSNGSFASPAQSGFKMFGYSGELARIAGLDYAANFAYSGLAFSTLNGSSVLTERARFSGANGNFLIAGTADDGTNKLQVTGSAYSTNGFFTTSQAVGIQGDGTNLYLKSGGTTYLNTGNTAYAQSNGNINGRDYMASRLDGTGVYYFASSGSRYLYYNGTNYVFNAAALDMSSNKIIGGSAGTASTDFIIKSQLDAVAANVAGTSGYIARFTSATAVGIGLVFDNGTNVGIGTTSPIFKLHVTSSGSTATYTGTGNINNGLLMGVAADGTPQILRYSGKGMVFGGDYNTTQTEQMRLDGNGNLGINTSTPRGLLDGAGVNSEFRWGNSLAQSLTIGNSRRLNYGDMLIGKNLKGQVNTDSYLTDVTDANQGYTAIELKYRGDIAFYGSNAATTANTVVTPNTLMYLNGTTSYVGIGTVVPDSRLDVIAASSAARLRVGYLSTGENYLDGTSFTVRTAAGTQLAKFTSTNLISNQPLSMTSQKITDMANGTGGADAVNLNQLTNINATWLVSGTIPDARLSTTIAQQAGNWGQLDIHGTFTDYNAVTRIGGSFVQGAPAANAPTWIGSFSNQGYQQIQALGSNYSWSGATASDYAQQTVIGRNSSTPYFGVRWKEAGVWSAWTKIWAGFADNAATANTLTTARNINGTPFNGSANVDVTEWLHSQRDFANGTLITTNINYAVSNGDAFFLEIKGNSYGNVRPVDIKVQGYIYTNTIINVGGTSAGTNITGMVAINNGGNLCFWFPNQGYWQGYAVNCMAVTGSGRNTNRVTSITDVAKPTTAKEVAISASIVQSLHSVNFNTYAPTLTGTGATGTWGINVTGSAGSVAWSNVTSKPTNLLYTTTGQGLNNENTYVNVRVLQNVNTSSSNDGMYIGYQNSNSGATRIFGGGSGSGGISVNGPNASDVTIAGNVVFNAGNYSAINLSSMVTGTLPDARLSSNVSFDNVNNNFSTTQTITGSGDTPLNLNKPSGTEWNYAQFNYAGTRRAYFGIESAANFIIGVDGTNKGIILSTTGTGITNMTGGANVSGTLSVGSTTTVTGAIESSINSAEGGLLKILNPSKTGAIANNWSIYNMTGAYGNGLVFWSYNQNGTGSQGRTLNINDDGTLDAVRGTISANDATAARHLMNRQSADARYLQASGTANYVAKFTAANTQAISSIFDNGSGVGFNTTNIKAALNSKGVASNALTSGTTVAANIMLENSSNNSILLMGGQSASPFGNWITSTDKSDLSINYPLQLQPFNGNVIVGAYSDNGAKFQVNGDAFHAGKVSVGGAINASYALTVNGTSLLSGNIVANAAINVAGLTTTNTLTVSSVASETNFLPSTEILLNTSGGVVKKGLTSDLYLNKSIAQGSISNSLANGTTFTATMEGLLSVSHSFNLTFTNGTTNSSNVTATGVEGGQTYSLRINIASGVTHQFVFDTMFKDATGTNLGTLTLTSTSKKMYIFRSEGGNFFLQD